MSKVVREKHLNIIALLLQATEVTARLIEEKKLQDCLVLFADCQESAVALGGHIEKLYGMNTKTVAILEQYCENLYQMSVALDEGVQVDAAYEALQQATKQIEAVYIEEFPDKKEVVFLPYKAAMWDSLESVWKAADEDPDCDAYVIPIPYYDLDRDGNFKEMHYEGDLYPKYVPITSYEDYDLEERHPDMIFIHNPYDEYNRVTRIEPKFFSSKIKDYTEKLVYIPYFVLGEIDPNDQVAIDGMCHFCYLPGTMYADKVIVQSEDMRQIYINEYLKADHANGGRITREALEKRILGLGSPKFDKAVNTRIEDLEIPEEWLRIIEKEDGSWKKIIFYNTSLSAFLQNSEQMLEKIKDVLQIFKENKDEVALLWRPHPLMMQTIESMRPEVRDAYKKIIQQYKDEKWGIYDDTPSMDMAVSISDEYYGDPSSVVQVYQETGKPAMLQNPLVLSENVSHMIANDGFCCDDKEGYFIGSKDGVLYQIQLCNFEIKPKVCLFDKNADTYRLYQKSIKYKNSIIILPDRAKSIKIYDIEKEILRERCLDTSLKGRLNIVNCWMEGNVLWCTTYESNKIFEISLDENEGCKEYDSFTDKSDQSTVESIKVGDSIYCISKTSTCISEFNTRTKVLVEYRIKTKEVGFNTITYVNQKFYLTGYAEKIYCWTKETNELEICGSIAKDFFSYYNREKSMPHFYRSLVMDEYIVFIPWNSEGSGSNSFYRFNMLTNEGDYFKASLSEESRKMREDFTIEYVNSKKEIIIYDSKISDVLCVDVRNKTLQKIGVSFEKEDMKILRMKLATEKQTILENSFNKIDDLWCDKLKRNLLNKSKVASDIWATIC